MLPGVAYTVTEEPSLMQLNCAIYLCTEKANVKEKEKNMICLLALIQGKAEGEAY